MKIKKYILAGFLAGLVFSSCAKKDKDSGFVRTSGGFAFKHCVENKTAPKAKVGDILLGELEIRLNDSTVLTSNFGSPDRLFKIESDAAGSVDELLLNLHIGDSAVLVLPSDSVARYVGGLVGRPRENVYFYLKVHQIISQKEISQHDKEVEQRQAEEDSTLAEWVARRYPKAERKESGLYILNKTSTEGKQAAWGRRVSVSYTVCDTAGKVLDTNVKLRAEQGGIYRPEQRYEPFEFELGDDGLIAGWTEGVSYMRKGERCKILIPSKIAYGELGYGAIAPFTPLVFELELVDVE